MEIGFGAATTGWDRHLRRAWTWVLAATMVGGFASSATAAEPDYMPVTDAYSFYQLCTDPELDGAGRVARLEGSGWERVELDGVPFPSGPDWDLNDPVHLIAIGQSLTSFTTGGMSIEQLKEKLDHFVESGDLSSLPFGPRGHRMVFSREQSILLFSERIPGQTTCRYLGPAADGSTMLYGALPGKDYERDHASRIRKLRFDTDFGTVEGGGMFIASGAAISQLLGQPAPDYFYFSGVFTLRE